MAYINVYGWVGYEMEYDNRIKTRVIFAIVDSKQQHLAWLLYAQDMPSYWQGAFETASVLHRKPDRNAIFGDATALPATNYYAGSDFRKLAPALHTTLGSRASIDIKDDPIYRGTTDCIIRYADLNGTLLDLYFELVTVGQRRNNIFPKPGRVYLLLLEKFSVSALKRGIRGPTALTHGVNPYDPVI